jgi:ATP-dependent RNA helicase DeaD
MLSATLPEAILALAKRYVRNAVRVASDPPGASNANISYVAHLVPPAQRFDAVVNLLLAAPDERTLIFTRTRAEATEMGAALANLGFAAAGLTGEMAQRERTLTLDAFRSGRTMALVATDVAARGIDVPEVSRVVHADLPGDGSTLTHRSGRTGRAGRKGTSVLLVPPFARGRAQQLLRAAGARAEFRAVPSADEIRERAEARLRTRLLGAESEVSPVHATLARSLLEASDPTTVVARLLGEVNYLGPCSPRAIHAPAPKEQKHRAEREGAPMHDRRSRQVFFRVNFGERHGATPARLLAMLCRRGGVRGSDVGAIRIGPAASTFAVAEPVARGFANAASRRDDREPHVRISVETGAAAGRY